MSERRVKVKTDVGIPAFVPCENYLRNIPCWGAKVKSWKRTCQVCEIWFHLWEFPKKDSEKTVPRDGSDVRYSEVITGESSIFEIFGEVSVESGIDGGPYPAVRLGIGNDYVIFLVLYIEQLLYAILDRHVVWIGTSQMQFKRNSNRK